MAQARPGVAHGVAELVGQEGHQNPDHRDLQAGEQARTRLQGRGDTLQPGLQPDSRAHTSPAPPGPVFVPTTAPSGATSSITAFGAGVAHGLGDVVRDALGLGVGDADAQTLVRARVLADEPLQLGQQACVAAHPPERLDLAVDQHEQGPRTDRPPTSACPRPMRPLRWRNSSVSNANTRRELLWKPLGRRDQVGQGAGPGVELARDAERGEREADRDRARVDDGHAAVELRRGQARRVDRGRERLRQVQREHVLEAVASRQLAVGRPRSARAVARRYGAAVDPPRGARRSAAARSPRSRAAPRRRSGPSAAPCACWRGARGSRAGRRSSRARSRSVGGQRLARHSALTDNAGAPVRPRAVQLDARMGRRSARPRAPQRRLLGGRARQHRHERRAGCERARDRLAQRRGVVDAARALGGPRPGAAAANAAASTAAG